MSECDGDNFCEVRVSPQGTIYSWDNHNRKLYVSAPDQASYDTYDLSSRSDFLLYGTDFVPFDTEGYVAFFSILGGLSNYLTRYTLSTGDMQTAEFPAGYRLTMCNQYISVRQRELRFIYPLGLDGKLLACTKSPERRPAIHVIDVNTLAIEQSIDLNERFRSQTEPAWEILGGYDGKIYILDNLPEMFIADLPVIDPRHEEIVLIYDIVSGSLTYQVVPFDRYFGFMVAALPDSSLLVRASTLNQYSSAAELIRKMDVEQLRQAGRGFAGVTLDGYVLFNAPIDYASMSVIKIDDYPLSGDPQME